MTLVFSVITNSSCGLLKSINIVKSSCKCYASSIQKLSSSRRRDLLGT